MRTLFNRFKTYQHFCLRWLNEKTIYNRDIYMSRLGNHTCWLRLFMAIGRGEMSRVTNLPFKNTSSSKGYHNSYEILNKVGKVWKMHVMKIWDKKQLQYCFFFFFVLLPFATTYLSRQSFRFVQLLKPNTETDLMVIDHLTYVSKCQKLPKFQ